MKRKKLICSFLAVSLLVLPACSNNASNKEGAQPSKEALENLNQSSMPIVKEPIKLNFFATEQNNKSDWNDILIWNKYSDMTNINVHWNQVPGESLEEERNLALTTGDLPDAFYIASIPTVDLFKYGQQGTFIKLNDLIDKYAPNLKKLMKENPEIKKAMTFPDGNIYSFPSIVAPDFLSVKVSARPYLNEEWLDALGMEMPQTAEEFYQFLKAVKTQDPNGNGKQDEVPYGGPSMSGLIGWLEGSFGVANRGVRNDYIDLNEETDKVRFFPIAEEYKELMKYLNKLYSEKLIQQNIYTIKWGQYIANATKGMYASTVFYDPVLLFGEETGKQFESMSALKGPHGQAFIKVAPTVASIGNFAITSANEHPAATVRWMDHFYSDEGARLFYMGVEGKTYKVTDDGKYVYLDKFTDDDDGISMEQEISQYLAWVGGFTGIIKKEYYQGSEATEDSIEAAQKLKPYIPDVIWPAFTYTEEENEFLTGPGADIEKYVSEMQAKFITGKVPFSEWDNYVNTVKGMGLDKYLEIQQAAYERYKES
ncbi:MAG TPA: hypothetical protein VF199_09250 [Bacillales bacterium]